jgi:hypothetical protein
MVNQLSERTPGTQLIVFLQQKVGIKEGIRVATFLVQWGAVARALKHAPTKEEYCVHWKESQATYYRELNRLKKVWPDEVSPQRKWEWVEANVKLPRGKLDEGAVLALLLAPSRP